MICSFWNNNFQKIKYNTIGFEGFWKWLILQVLIKIGSWGADIFYPVRGLTEHSLCLIGVQGVAVSTEYLELGSRCARVRV